MLNIKTRITILLLSVCIILANNVANAKPQELMSKAAVLAGEIGTEPEDIQGWNYTVLDPNDGLCYTYYEEQNGTSTQQVEVSCSSFPPIGPYSKKFSKAIKIMRKKGCGDEFIGITLDHYSFPLPVWYIFLQTDIWTVIDANSGMVLECKYPMGPGVCNSPSWPCNAEP